MYHDRRPRFALRCIFRALLVAKFPRKFYDANSAAIALDRSKPTKMYARNKFPSKLKIQTGDIKIKHTKETK